MHAGMSAEFFWIDSQKKNLRVPAPQYVDFVMSWVQGLLRDELQFPTKAGLGFFDY